MGKRVLIIFMCALYLFVSMQLFSDDDKKMKLSDVPGLVVKSVYNAVPDILVFEVKQKNKKQEMTFVIKGIKDNDVYEFKLKGDGSVITQEIKKPDKDEVPLSEVPDIVKNSSKKVLEGIHLYKAKVKNKKTMVVYELEGIIGDKIYEFEIKDDGTILEIELDD
ncbi:MAG: hypothetical protein JXR70_11020 [Spirochaetales bacterium]|nr:hypothetical protein [Spirochaetales bacterium]